MPIFSYTAIDDTGKQFAAAQRAESLSVLEAVLAERGSWLVKARVVKKAGSQADTLKASFQTKIKRWDLINFYTQLALLLNAGVTLSSALGKLASDLGEAKLGPIVGNLANQVEAGTPLPQAMADFPKAFSAQAIALIEAGEASGKLPEALATLTANLEWLDGLVANARQALIYPMAISAAAIGLVALLFTVVVPRFEAIFTELRTPMPWITNVVLSISEFFASSWYLWLPLAIGIPILLATTARQPKIALLRDRCLLAIPFIGELSRCLALSQFSITLEMLIRSGIPLARALELSARQATNSLVAQAAQAARQAVNEGRPMSDEFAKQPIFTQTFLTIVQTGERSGQLDVTLDKIGNYYNTILPRKIKAFFSVFEPAIIVTLTTIVGTVALALVLPIMQLWNVS